MSRLGERLNSRNFDNYLDSIVNDSDIEMPEIPDTQSIEYEATSENLPQKMDVMLLNNGWNDKNERMIISIGENAASYKWMHEKSASQYSTYHRIFGILLIVTSTALTAESILPDNNNNLAVSITRRIFTYIITILSVVGNFLKLAKMSEQHLSSAIAFSKLYHGIQQQMCMYRRDRKNATKYAGDILKQYDTLVVNAPMISSKIVTQFKNTFKSSDIALPDIADRIQKIEIVTESPPAGDTNKKQVNFEDVKDKRYGRYGMNNLKEIHNCFQISGDITDNDIQNATPTQLRELKHKYLTGKSEFEYERFKLHANEND
jgi:hypothetical protein